MEKTCRLSCRPAGRNLGGCFTCVLKTGKHKCQPCRRPEGRYCRLLPRYVAPSQSCTRNAGSWGEPLLTPVLRDRFLGIAGVLQSPFTNFTFIKGVRQDTQWPISCRYCLTLMGCPLGNTYTACQSGEHNPKYENKPHSVPFTEDAELSLR